MSAARLTPRQAKGLAKVGRVIVPGGDGMPTFAAVDPASRAPAVLAELPDTDERDLRLLFTVLGWLPALLVRAIVALLWRARPMPGPVGNLARLAYLALKGVAMSLYYSDEAVLDALGYDVSVPVGPLAGADARGARPGSDLAPR